MFRDDPNTRVESLPMETFQATPTLRARGQHRTPPAATQADGTFDTEHASPSCDSSTSSPDSIPLLNDSAPDTSKAKSFFWLLCSSLKFPILYNICSKSRNWPAIRRDAAVDVTDGRLKGVPSNLIHILGFAPALALILLNASSLYLGGDMPGTEGYDSEKLFGLLFAAKLHELMMLASLASILSTYIRMELDRDASSGLPFGALFSPFQFQNLSFLLSSEMTGIFFYKWGKGLRKGIFICLVVACCVLGVSVGPSSATLTRPRLAIWAAGGTTFWVGATQEELYPKEMAGSSTLSSCLADSGNLSCPAGNWEILNQAYFSYWPQVEQLHEPRVPQSMPGYITVQSPYSGRDFRMKSRGPVMWPAVYTLASVPVSPLADAVAELGRLWSSAASRARDVNYKYRQEAYFKLEALQPAVFVQCQTKAGFPIIKTNTSDPDNVRMQIDGFVPAKDIEFEHPPDADSPSIVWLDDQSLMEKLNSSIAAVVVVPGSESRWCTIKAVFAPTTYQAKWSMQKVVSGWPNGIEDKGLTDDTFQNIAIKESWARYLNPSVSGTNNTALHSIMRSAGIWDAPPSSRVNRGFTVDVVVESILAALVANGISRAKYDSRILLHLSKGNWSQEIISGSSKFWSRNDTKLGNAFNTPEDNGDRSTQLTFRATVHGFAYNWAGTAQGLTTMVLILYMSLVLIHLVLFVLSRRSWAGWNSLPEAAAVIMKYAPEGTYEKLTGPVGGEHGLVEGYKEKVNWHFMQVMKREATSIGESP